LRRLEVADQGQDADVDGLDAGGHLDDPRLDIDESILLERSDRRACQQGSFRCQVRLDGSPHDLRKKLRKHLILIETLRERLHVDASLLDVGPKLHQPPRGVLRIRSDESTRYRARRPEHGSDRRRHDRDRCFDVD
jgi:hypothetical protein